MGGVRTVRSPGRLLYLRRPSPQSLRRSALLYLPILLHFRLHHKGFGKLRKNCGLLLVSGRCRRSVCEKEGYQNHGAIIKSCFRSLEQLKGHLFHKHRLLMCCLCLEGRRVFICEHKLYTKAQLNQHISSGDSVNDNESERGSFMGHPMCEFCKTPFYGENELYRHMSTEHFTCHICQRQNPGQFKYYRNYDDLEVHFRQGHYLCENEECLGKKFIVFQVEAELKKHNGLEHGGRMSRCKRNAVLQIPTSFNYRRTNESGDQLGRGRTFRRQPTPNNQLSLAIQASLETNNAESRHADRPALSSVAQQAPANEGTIIFDSLLPSFESLAAGDSELASRYHQTVSHNYSHSFLAESSFPPLTATPGNSQQNPKQDKDGVPENTMAAHLRKRNLRHNVKILYVAQSRPAANCRPAFPSVSSSSSNNMPISLPGTSRTHMSTARRPIPSTSSSSIHAVPLVNNTGLAYDGSSSSRIASGSVTVKHTASASVSDCPPLSYRSGSAIHAPKVGYICNANKSLVEMIRAALDHNKDLYAAFKEISHEYRVGFISGLCYLEYVKQFGLLHLVQDIAKLCPDPLKQKELIEAYKSSFQSNRSQEMLSCDINIPGKENSSSKLASGKKLVVAGSSSSSKGEAEILGNDGYHAPRSRLKASVDEAPAQQLKSGIGPSTARVQNELPSNGGSGKQSGDGVRKQGKNKTSKFLRARIGDGSAAAFPNPRPPGDDLSQESTSNIQHSSAHYLLKVCGEMLVVINSS